MKINSITAYDYLTTDRTLDLILGCTVDEALAMTTAVISVTTDTGDFVEAFAGYVKRSATVDAATGRVTLSLYLDTDGAGAAAEALAQELAAAGVTITDLQAQINEQAAAIEEMAVMMAGGQ